MARPKLPEGKKKVNVSFTLTEQEREELFELIPAGERSEWIGKVVSKALRGLRTIKKNRDGKQ